MMPKFRKKPVEIEAVRYDGRNGPQIAAWMGSACHGSHTHPDGLAIPTLEGTMVASPGDWIIRGVKGEFYPCKPEIFAATYDPVGGDVPAACA